MVEGSAPPSTPKARKRKRPLCVLLVDADEATRQVFEQVVAVDGGRRMKLVAAQTISEARRQLAAQRVDLVAVAAGVSRQRGIGFAAEVRRGAAPTQAIVLADEPKLDDAVAALRAGAADFILKPIAVGELRDRISRVLERYLAEAKKHSRLRRLQRACRKLSDARDEVSQQVDILCNDLVTAYRELADQMHQVVETSEFAAMLRRELDLERLLHQTLEFILEKAGPTNAAIFLPVTADEFTLGGYVNYDCADGSPELLLNHMADVIAPAVAEEEAAYHITENDALTEWLGDDASYLQDCHLLAVPCWTEGEALAVLVLFRDAGQPFSEPIVATTTAIAPMLAEYLAKVIRVHHRHVAQ